MLTRRALLALAIGASAGLAGLAGCSDQPTATVDPQLQADHDALVAALDAEGRLWQQVQAAPGRRVPTGAVEAVAAHLDALARSVASAVPTPGPSGSSAPATGALAAAARLAARQHLAAVPTTTGPVARLLASVAASDLALAAAAGAGVGAARGPARLPTTPQQPLVDAWQAMLRAEQQAVYAYQVVAARLRADGDTAAAAAESGVEVHQGRRSRAEIAVTGLGAEPQPPDAAYALPEQLAAPGAHARLLTDVEQACCEAAAGLVAVTDPDLRRLPVDWLAWSAQAEAGWSGTVPPLPGLGP